ncbi:MAG: redoxin domain-containing protein [Rhizobiaceae bacterium]|nr:redoxin domain-containing protein [Rhizobiaceae bacterium]
MALLDTPICDFGAPAPSFNLATPAGAAHSLEQSVGPNGLLVVFICNHCPYVVAIGDRLAQDAKTLQEEGFGVVAIMSNDYQDYAADSPENMVKFADKYGFTFPYLVDETQQVGRAYGAVCTPDFFGYNRNLELQYRGRIDDCRPGATQDQIDSRSTDLLNAMRQIGETGEGPRDQIASAGCSIKWR